MGEKDIAERILLDYDEVFADVVNVLLFGGEDVVDPNDLEAAQTVSMYKDDEDIHEQERDISKFWKIRVIRDRSTNSYRMT